MADTTERQLPAPSIRAASSSGREMVAKKLASRKVEKGKVMPV